VVEIVCYREGWFQALIITETFVQVLDLRSQIADFIDSPVQLGNRSLTCMAKVNCFCNAASSALFRGSTVK